MSPPAIFPPAAGPWPVSEPEAVGVDAERLDDLIRFVSDHPSDPIRGEDKSDQKAALLREVLGQDADSDCVGPFVEPGDPCGLVVRNGYLVGEFGDTRHVDEIASATKSFLSILTGVALQRGLLDDVHRSVFDDTGLDMLADDHNRRITWHHLLQQTSEWDGELFGKHPTGHRGDRLGESVEEPGFFWEYNDVRVNLLARCLLELFRRPLPDALRESVMDPIGASPSWQWHGYSTSWVEVDRRRVQSVSGGSHWGGGIWMSASDLARVGLLYLRGGMWEDHRVLPAGWIEQTRQSCDLNHMYGYLWWLQHDAEGNQVSFAASGGGSHHVFVVPAHDLVVTVKWIRDDAWPAFLDRALALVTDSEPLGPVRYEFGRINRPS